MKTNLVKLILSVGIAILFTVFVMYSWVTVYEQPRLVGNKCESCIGIADNLEYAKCNTENSLCNENRSVARAELKDRYFRHSLFGLLAIALAAIAGGYFLLKKSDTLGSGFLLGSLFLAFGGIVYTERYWGDWPAGVKLACLGLLLVIFVALAYKKIEEKLNT